MRKYTSVKIANISFMCSILIVLIHATTYAFNRPGSATESIYGWNISTFVQMFLAEGICRIAVPMFFIISGYLFFVNFEPTADGILRKYKKRFFSLVIPFFIWSGGVFAFYAVAQSIPQLAPFFSTRQVTDISIVEMLNYIFINPLNSPLWFLKDLIILAFFSPLIYWLVKKAWFFLLPVVVLCWVLGIGFLTVRSDAICAFSIGSFLALKPDLIHHCKNAVFERKIHLTVLGGVLWAVILIIKSCYLCSSPVSLLLNGEYTGWYNFLSLLNIAVGVPTVWLLYDAFAKGRRVERIKWCGYGMMLFVMHHPIVLAFKKLLVKAFGSGMLLSLFYYFASAGITIFIIIVVSTFFRKYMPRLYKVLSGGRV